MEVLSLGLLTTVQDLGRHGYQRYGVPVCGPVDEFALQAANALAGNPPGAAGLELTVSGPVLRFHADMLLALTGGDLACRLHSVDLGAWDVPLWTAPFLRAGSVLECRGRRSGCRAYLALAGGIVTPPVLASQATCLSGGFGGYGGRALAAGAGPVAAGGACGAGGAPAGVYGKPVRPGHPWAASRLFRRRCAAGSAHAAVPGEAHFGPDGVAPGGATAGPCEGPCGEAGDDLRRDGAGRGPGSRPAASRSCCWPTARR